MCNYANYYLIYIILLKFPIFTNILKCLTVSKLQKC